MKEGFHDHSVESKKCNRCSLQTTKPRGSECGIYGRMFSTNHANISNPGQSYAELNTPEGAAIESATGNQRSKASSGASAMAVWSSSGGGVQVSVLQCGHLILANPRYRVLVLRGFFGDRDSIGNAGCGEIANKDCERVTKQERKASCESDRKDGTMSEIPEM